MMIKHRFAAEILPAGGLYIAVDEACGLRTKAGDRLLEGEHAASKITGTTPPCSPISCRVGGGGGGWGEKGGGGV